MGKRKIRAALVALGMMCVRDRDRGLRLMLRSIQVSTADLMKSEIGIGAQVRFLEFYGREVQPFLTEAYRPTCLLASPLQAESKFAYFRALPAFARSQKQISMLETLCDERRQLADQERLHRWLHVWLLVHIPLSVLLLVLGVAHAVVALYY